MANADRGVVIYDAEFENARQIIVDYCNELSGMISRYCECVQAITEQGIQDQLIANRLQNLSAQMSQVGQRLIDISENTNEYCTRYIKEIDAADEFLY